MSSTPIAYGPSKFDLMQNLFVRKSQRQPVTFHLTEGAIITALINSIEREDDSGESWNITGYVGNNKKWTAYYRTDKRTGLYAIK